MINFKGACFLFGVVIVLSGCGGGGGSTALSGPGSGPSTGSAQTGRIGQMSLAYVGKLQPSVSTGTNGVTVTSAFGVSFTSVALFPNKTLATTSIAFNYGLSLWTTQNGVESQLTGLPQGLCYNPIWTPSGLLSGTSYDVGAKATQVFVCYPDGSGFTKVTNSSRIYLGSRVTWSPNGAKIAYDTSTGSIYQANSNGTSESLLISNAVEPSYSPDGTRIAFEAFDGTSYQIYSEAANGGPTTLISIQNHGYNCSMPVWSPDSKYIAFNVDTGSSQFVAVNGTNGSIFLTIAPASGSFDSMPSFSPDGTKVAFLRAGSYQGDTGYITTSGFLGENPTAVQYISTGAAAVATAWSNFAANRLYVGASGSMGATASGFIWGQANDVFASLLTFTATTPSKALITPQAGDGSGPLVYNISADTITGLKYTDAYFGQVITVIPDGGANPASVLASFNAGTGQIDTVAPFIATRAISKPQIIRTGSNMVYKGRFSAVWNHGKNVAPKGASQLVLDGAKGTLISFH